MLVSVNANAFADVVLMYHGCKHAPGDATVTEKCAGGGCGAGPCEEKSCQKGVEGEKGELMGEKGGRMEIGLGIAEGDKEGKASGGIDYSKWQAIDAKLAHEETRDPEKTDPAKNQIWGCAQDHRKERDIYERPNSEKIMIAEDFKKQGDDAYREKKLEEADYCYQKVCFTYPRLNFT